MNDTIEHYPDTSTACPVTRRVYAKVLWRLMPFLLYLAFDVMAVVMVLGSLVLLIGIPAHCLKDRRGSGA